MVREIALSLGADDDEIEKLESEYEELESQYLDEREEQGYWAVFD